MSSNTFTTTISIDDILAQFGVNTADAFSTPTEINLADNDVVQLLLSELQMNDTCGVFDDLNSLLNRENMLAITEPPTSVADDGFGGIAAFFENAFDSAVDAVDNVMDWIENTPGLCNANERETFTNVMDDFGSCTGLNFRELLDELMASEPVMQAGLRCTGELLRGITPQPGDSFCEDVATSEDTNVAALDTFNDCVDGMLADNMLGEFFRVMMVTPGAMCNCMSGFDRLPDCRMDMFQTSGKQMKKYACAVNGQTCPFFADACDGRLNALDECLPSLSELTEGSGTFVASEETCRDVMCTCEALNDGQMNYPARMMELPLADMCVEKAPSLGTSIAERYELFQNVCVNADLSTTATVEDLNIFEEPVVNDQETLTTTAVSDLRGDDTDVLGPVTTISKNTMEETNSAEIATELEVDMLLGESTEVKSNKGSCVGLWIGVALAIGLLILACAVLLNRRRRKQRETYIVGKESMASDVTSDQDIEISTKGSVATDEASQQDI